MLNVQLPRMSPNAASKFFFLHKAIVAVTSCRSLKLHGGQPKDNLTVENVEAVRAGLVNMAAHIKHLK